MRSLLAGSLLAIVLLARAAPSPECAHRVKESIPPPRGWDKVRPAPANHTIELRIGLQRPNVHNLEQHLLEVSDPFHPRYGQHLSKAEVEALIEPHPISSQLVDDWLASHEISEEQITRTPGKDWVKIKVPVALAEKMLETEYHIWTHLESGDSLVRTTSYSLPDYLMDHVDLVQPTTLFARFRGMKTTLHFSTERTAITDTNPGTISVPTASGGQVNASCNSTVTPSCLLDLYNAAGYEPAAAGQNKIAVTGYLEEYANYEDFHLFNEALVPAAANSNFSVVYVNGGLNNQTPSEAGAEANLDTQYAFGLTYPTPGTFYTTGGSPPFIPDDGDTQNYNEPYAEWLDYVLNSTDLPQTISTSYGDDEQTVPYSYATRVCSDFAQLGALGVSILFSSGDGGVGDGDPDPATQECYSNDGTNKTMFIPGFPASCPYVTAVGGTAYIPEVAANFSGGGFSNYFSRPSYQDAAVANFLATLPAGTYEGLYNPNGRAYPDVSAQSENFEIYWDAEAYLVAGTSCSSPTFAGFVSLLNDARIANGLSPLGFLNPLIYALGTNGTSGFNDITEGNNPGCGTEGFNATIGWDAVTGWGTPNFGVLKQIVLGNLSDFLA
ncbi:subtilisin-like protein [Wolfiporia cocos MD-104 SS10]|uniref:tripeptidyl-peptidase II n=1 Tax=Wolfiporia cocos (strain MD-104) TaxID=742152 RepID=A0A2H3JKL5_WOLCO|nr:subtilisin-like protein [Wolfiporia cocos MD-104 SS10]